MFILYESQKKEFEVKNNNKPYKIKSIIDSTMYGKETNN